MNTYAINPFLACEYVKSRNSPDIRFLYTLSKGNHILPFKTLTEMTSYVKTEFKTRLINKYETALAGLVYLNQTDGNCYNLNVTEFIALRSEEASE